MQDFINYNEYSRQEWSQFHGAYFNNISDEDLDKIKSVDDQVSLADVQEIYTPLRHLIHVYFHNYQQLSLAKADFLGKKPHKVPFIIGISGSVAVGKSTTARLLKVMLQRAYPQYKIEQMTTDGFLYPNEELERRNILADKGFPWSYDNEKLLNFLEAVKANQGSVTYPSYSHIIYDIVPDHLNELQNPDILIIEGINVLQLPQNQNLYVSDYFDFSIYVDADPQLIEKWFIHRFEGFLIEENKNPNPDNFYYQFTKQPLEQALATAHQVWRDVNYNNLVKYIAPTMNRADLILHKTKHHKIDHVLLKKY
ncbi:type I pantothenate kinase [Bombilactobacillus thymidiniphilus]|uniref:Pantothenate kinase n=1 Tax=Bombilactobacillus thymidiniphilus TaxID=2923363 RepID=A0ABY4PFQ6_9LACO|nr:type I pantothenate kinase [Bombilactobacillus thymidiniphilus]UQS84339.1 type I pantothenate kinase [Bombilactobacillus thymidiniphilus]